MNSTKPPAPSIEPTSTPDVKVLSDLSVCREKIALCTSLLHPLNSTREIESHPESESILAIIGFLEACVPRVRELIEAGMSGALKEQTVVKCLEMNDELCQVLEFVDHPEKCLPGASSRASGSRSGISIQKPNIEEKFDFFGINDEGEDFTNSQTSAKAAAALDDLLAPVEVNKKQNGMSDHDDFLT